MENTYTTKQGDAWDAIAHKVYGNVKYTGWLMQNNFPYLDFFVFSAGVVLQTPDLPTDGIGAGMPIWRTGQ
jgi:Uncharacterized protein containing LysM domain